MTLGSTKETAEQIARMFLPTAQRCAVEPLAGGLSGAAVFVCEADNRRFALKRWPAGTSAVRVDEIHELMAESRRALALVPALVCSPLGTTRLSWEGQHYELAAWLSGEPFGGERGSAMLAAVQAGAEVIASFHDSLRRRGCTCAPPPAVLRRLGRIEQLQSQLPLALASRAALSPALRLAADWLRLEGLAALNAASGLLGPWAGEVVPTQLVLRDVHRGHILFTAEQPSGLVDFDAVGRDTVATDLARWVGGFLAPDLDPQPIWDAAAAGYGSVRPISACELTLASAMSQASDVIYLVNWVVWVALRQRDFSACQDLVDRRVGELMRRMVPGVIGSDAMR